MLAGEMGRQVPFVEIVNADGAFRLGFTAKIILGHFSTVQLA
jgi:hypothetical protein